MRGARVQPSPRRGEPDRGIHRERVMALRDALAALDGHGFHDTAHDRVRALLACDECGHQPEQHEYDGGGSCTALTGFPGRGYPCPCIEWECKNGSSATPAAALSTAANDRSVRSAEDGNAPSSSLENDG